VGNADVAWKPVDNTSDIGWSWACFFIRRSALHSTPLTSWRCHFGYALLSLLRLPWQQLNWLHWGWTKSTNCVCEITRYMCLTANITLTACYLFRVSEYGYYQTLVSCLVETLFQIFPIFPKFSGMTFHNSRFPGMHTSPREWILYAWPRFFTYFHKNWVLWPKRHLEVYRPLRLWYIRS